MADHNYEAIIVGAGPVGLFLACELALFGLRTLILERDVEPKSIWKDELGIRGLNILSSETLYRRDLLDPLLSQTQRSKIIEKTIKERSDAPANYAGHFAGIVLDANKLDLTMSRWKYYIPGPTTLTVGTKMVEIETVFAQRAEELGVTILRGEEVVSIHEEADSVTVCTQTSKVRTYPHFPSTQNPNTNAHQIFKTPYLIGCDGGRSLIRRLSGIPFRGGTDEAYGYKAVFSLDRPLPHGLIRTEAGIYINFASGWYIVDLEAFDRSTPITIPHLQSVVQRVTQTDVKITELKVATTFSLRSVQAEQYRKGRILLAGDAAHIHSPIGAQGVSLGIGDAVNLGWKIAATVKGTAAPGLLDTYHDERHPVAAAVLKWASAQSAILQPGPMGRAAYDIFADLISTEAGNTYFTERVSGLGHRYAIDGEESHGLVGHSVPDFEFSDGKRLGEMARGGDFMVVDFGETEGMDVEEVKSWGPLGVRYIGGEVNDGLGLRALAVRPDGVVCWVAGAGGLDVQDLKRALGRWVVLPTVEQP